MVLVLPNSNSDKLTEIEEEIAIEDESHLVMGGAGQQVVDADTNDDDLDDEDEEIDKMQRFDELIGAAFNDLNGTNSVSYASDTTDHNIPDISNENATTGSEIRILREKLARLEIEQTERVQELMQQMQAKDERLELLETENGLLRKEQANSNELFERIDRLENEKTAMIEGYESKRVNYETELTGWQRKWTEEKNARERELERCDRLAQELASVRSELETCRKLITKAERKSIGTSTTNLQKSILKEIHGNEPVISPVKPTKPAGCDRSTSTLAWPQLLDEITEMVSDQCESVLETNYAKLIDSMNTEIQRLRKRLADLELNYSHISIKYWSYLTKIETLFS